MLSTDLIVQKIQETSEPVQEHGEVLEDLWLDTELYDAERGFADDDVGFDNYEGALQINVEEFTDLLERLIKEEQEEEDLYGTQVNSKQVWIDLTVDSNEGALWINIERFTDLLERFIKEEEEEEEDLYGTQVPSKQVWIDLTIDSDQGSGGESESESGNENDRLALHDLERIATHEKDRQRIEDKLDLSSHVDELETNDDDKQSGYTFHIKMAD